MLQFCGVIHKEIGDAKAIPGPKGLSYHYSYLHQLIDVFTDEEMEIPGTCFIGFLYNDEGTISTKDGQHILENPASPVSGSWAYARVCEVGNEVLLNRDPIGARSLYYTETATHFIFATNIKLIFSTGLVKPALDYERVFDFFVNNDFDNLDAKLFKDIHEFPPGHIGKYRIKEKQWNLNAWFRPSTERELITYDPQEQRHYVDNIKHRLDHISDIIFKQSGISSSLLSGGLDSSVIALMAKWTGRSDWKFYTAGFPGMKIDESQFVSSFLKHLNFGDWQMVEPSGDDFKKEIEQMIYSTELPSLSAGTFLQYYLMKFMGERGVHEVVDGTGADALFAGHHYHYAFQWKELLRNAKLRQLSHEFRVNQIIDRPLGYLLRNEIKYNKFRNLPLWIRWRYQLNSHPELRFLGKDILEQRFDKSSQQMKQNYSGLNELLFDEYYQGGVRKLLRFVNRTSENFGIKAHFPFVYDRKLSDLMFRIPGSYKISEGRLKYLLREALVDELPDYLYRGGPKKGLLSPNNKWIRENKEVWKTYILEAAEGVFDIRELEKGLNKFLQPEQEMEDYRIYKFISFAVWRKVYNL